MVRDILVVEGNSPSCFWSLTLRFISSSGLNLIGGNRLVLFDPGKIFGTAIVFRLKIDSNFAVPPSLLFLNRLEPCSRQTGCSSVLARRTKEEVLHISFSCDRYSGGEDLSAPTLQRRSSVGGRRQGTSELAEY